MKLSTLIPSVLIGAGALTGLQAQNVQSTSADSTATVLEIKKETKEQGADTTKYLFSPTYGYAGQLTGIIVPDDITEDPTISSSTRVGGGAKAAITENISAYGLGVVEFNPQAGKSWGAGQGYLSIKSRQGNNKVQIGQKASPITLIRPFPVTGAGQFETSTQAMIPGGALGIYDQWSAGYFNGAFGVYKRGGDMMYGANLGIKKNGLKANLGAEYTDKETFASALNGSYKGVSADLVLKQSPEKTDFGYDLIYVHDVSDKASVIAYLVQNWHGKEKTATEIGALLAGKMNINGIELDVTAGVGHDFVGESTNVYVHLYKDLDWTQGVKPGTTKSLFDMLKNKKRTTNK